MFYGFDLLALRVVIDLIRLELNDKAFKFASVLPFTGIAFGLQQVVHTVLPPCIAFRIFDVFQIDCALLELVTISRKFAHLWTHSLLLVPNVFIYH